MEKPKAQMLQKSGIWQTWQFSMHGKHGVPRTWMFLYSPSSQEGKQFPRTFEVLAGQSKQEVGPEQELQYSPQFLHCWSAGSLYWLELHLAMQVPATISWFSLEHSWQFEAVSQEAQPAPQDLHLFKGSARSLNSFD
jgi:hypothetical protein